MHVIVKGIDYVQANAYIQLVICIQTCYAFMQNFPTVSIILASIILFLVISRRVDVLREV